MLEGLTSLGEKEDGAYVIYRGSESPIASLVFVQPSVQ